MASAPAPEWSGVARSSMSVMVRAAAERGWAKAGDIRSVASGHDSLPTPGGRVTAQAVQLRHTCARGAREGRPFDLRGTRAVLTREGAKPTTERWPTIWLNSLDTWEAQRPSMHWSSELLHAHLRRISGACSLGRRMRGRRALGQCPLIGGREHGLAVRRGSRTRARNPEGGGGGGRPKLCPASASQSLDSDEDRCRRRLASGPRCSPNSVARPVRMHHKL